MKKIIYFLELLWWAILHVEDKEWMRADFHKEE